MLRFQRTGTILIAVNVLTPYCSIWNSPFISYKFSQKKKSLCLNTFLQFSKLKTIYQHGIFNRRKFFHYVRDCIKNSFKLIHYRKLVIKNLTLPATLHHYLFIERVFDLLQTWKDAQWKEQSLCHWFNVMDCGTIRVYNENFCNPESDDTSPARVVFISKYVSGDFSTVWTFSTVGLLMPFFNHSPSHIFVGRHFVHEWWHLGDYILGVTYGVSPVCILLLAQ